MFNGELLRDMGILTAAKVHRPKLTFSKMWVNPITPAVFLYKKINIKSAHNCTISSIK
jgi:hypothetical protein